jgi:hypothetical protein
VAILAVCPRRLTVHRLLSAGLDFGLPPEPGLLSAILAVPPHGSGPAGQAPELVRTGTEGRFLPVLPGVVPR